MSWPRDDAKSVSFNLALMRRAAATSVRPLICKLCANMRLGTGHWLPALVSLVDKVSVAWCGAPFGGKNYVIKFVIVTWLLDGLTSLARKVRGTCMSFVK